MKKLIWRYLIVSMLPYMLFAGSDMFCLVCHGSNQTQFSQMVPKNVWLDLTSDGGKKLQKIHQNNLDVQAYLKSSLYDEKVLFQYISFFSDTQREYDAKAFAKKCFVCHQSLLHLSSFYTKREWSALNNSLEKLIEKHQYQKLVLRDLRSRQFVNVLPKFIKYISFHAPDKAKYVRKDSYSLSKTEKKLQKIKPKGEKRKQKSSKITNDTNLTMPPASKMDQMKTKRLVLFYDKENLPKEQALVVMQEIQSKLKKISKKRDKMTIWLYKTGSHPYVSDVLFSMILIGLSPVRHADSWIMKVESKGMVYYAKATVITVHGLSADSASEYSEPLKDKVGSMIEEISKQIKEREK